MNQKQLARMTNKELNKFVAKVIELLGWPSNKIGAHIVPFDLRFVVRAPISWDGRIDDEALHQLLVWPIVGLAIEKAREWGWELHFRDRGVSFYKLAEDSLDVESETKFNSAIDLGSDITAILSAFTEIPKPVEDKICG